MIQVTTFSCGTAVAKLNCQSVKMERMLRRKHGHSRRLLDTVQSFDVFRVSIWHRITDTAPPLISHPDAYHTAPEYLLFASLYFIVPFSCIHLDVVFLPTWHLCWRRTCVPSMVIRERVRRRERGGFAQAASWLYKLAILNSQLRPLTVHWKTFAVKRDVTYPLRWSLPREDCTSKTHHRAVVSARAHGPPVVNLPLVSWPLLACQKIAHSSS